MSWEAYMELPLEVESHDGVPILYRRIDCQPFHGYFLMRQEEIMIFGSKFVWYEAGGS